MALRSWSRGVSCATGQHRRYTDTHQPGSAETSTRRLFTKWGSHPPDVEYNLTHNRTELHDFQRLASTPISLYPPAWRNRDFHSLSPDLGSEAQKEGIPLCKGTRPGGGTGQDSNPRP